MNGQLGVFHFQITYNLKQIKPLCQVSKSLCWHKIIETGEFKFLNVIWSNVIEFFFKTKNIENPNKKQFWILFVQLHIWYFSFS